MYNHKKKLITEILFNQIINKSLKIGSALALDINNE